MPASRGGSTIDVRENRWTSDATKVQPRLAAKTTNQPLRLCHVGGMAIHKGYPLLRQAVHQLPAGLNLSFTIIDHRLQEDDPPYTSSWKGYPVRFIPAVAMEAMADFYAQQDVLLAPSIWPESFGLVSREALSAYLWVIASDIGALAEPLEDGRNGNIIPPNDSKALANAIQRLFESWQERDALHDATFSSSATPNAGHREDPEESRLNHAYAQLLGRPTA
jgi:glycosyltransferase involved in cell wall biosynthesis